jgi:Asp-tRNA(Asn)/Glu-tRNA(Gln) amidotransferase A subunit family amidase
MTRTAVQTAEAVRRGELSARAATEQALARIAERDPDLCAFRTVRHERALADAEQIDAHPARAAMPLAGVPVAIKDNVAQTQGGGSGRCRAHQRSRAVRVRNYGYRVRHNPQSVGSEP